MHSVSIIVGTVAACESVCNALLGHITGCSFPCKALLASCVFWAMHSAPGTAWYLPVVNRRCSETEVI